MSGELTVAKYIRLSVDDAQTDSMSIENQRLILDSHIEKLSLENARITEFVDNGYSGTNFERPAVQELLELAQTGRINAILVKDFSRFGRSSIEMGYFLERVFPLFRIRFISVCDDYDSAEHDGSAGGVDVTFKLLMHEQYSRDLSNKIRSSKRERIRRGEYCHSFFGYRKVAGKLVIDESAADTVRRIFALAQAGTGLHAIAEVLYNEKRPTPSAYKRDATDCIWGSSVILQLLQNEQYTGTYVGGKFRTLEVGSGKQIQLDENEWVKIPDHHPAIVSREVFEAVQAVRRRNKPYPTPKQKPKAKQTSLLKGKVVCGECGHVMSLVGGVFRCKYTSVAKDMACYGLQANVKMLETQMLAAIREKAAGLEAIKPVDDVSPYEEEIVRLKNEKAGLYERLVFGELEKEAYITESLALTARLEDVRQAHAAVLKQAESVVADAAFGAVIEEFRGKRVLTPEIVGALVDRVRVFADGNIAVEWRK